VEKPDTQSKRPSAVVEGGLAFVFGFILGFAVGYIWNNSQIHTMPSGYVLRGEHRAMVVIGNAFLSAIVGGLFVSAIALIRLKLSTPRPSSAGKDETSP